MYMTVLCACLHTMCMYVCYVCIWCLWRPKEGIKFLKLELRLFVSYHAGARESNLSPLEEREVPLTLEPSLQPPENVTLKKVWQIQKDKSCVMSLIKRDCLRSTGAFVGNNDKDFIAEWIVTEGYWAAWSKQYILYIFDYNLKRGNAWDAFSHTVRQHQEILPSSYQPSHPQLRYIDLPPVSWRLSVRLYACLRCRQGVGSSDQSNIWHIVGTLKN